VVLALIAGVVYVLKLLSARKYPAGLKAKGIQVLATRPLGPRQALLLVEVGGMPLLLAQGEGMVNLLAEIRDPEAVKRLNDLYGFRETPFEAELRERMDVESQDEKTAPAGERPVSPEERLAALRRRPKPGEES
jgi:flagellar protein FliO/FliZ